MMFPHRDESYMSVDASPSTSMQYTESSPSTRSFPKFHSTYQLMRRASSSGSVSPLTETSRRTYNPFNQNLGSLKERWTKPVVSPDVFSHVVSPTEDSNEFKWTIEDLSRIKPAPIEEEFQFEEPVDEQTESEIQRNIDTYFKMNHHVPSPMDIQQARLKKRINTHVNPHMHPVMTPPYQPFGLGSISRTPSQDVSTQTALSLPPDLPANIESMLKPYFSDTSSDDLSFNMNLSLRRKLFAMKDDDPSPGSFCRAREDSPMINVRTAGVFMSRTEGSPCFPLSPLGISPILADRKSVCNKVMSPIHSTAQGNDHEKENTNPTHKNQTRVYDECFLKMFESPKLTVGARRNLKRRRSFSRDMDTSTSYSHFSAKHNSTEEAASRGSVCADESKVCMDILSDNAVDSEDTGYRTASFKIGTLTNSRARVDFGSWMTLIGDGANNVHASTPTREPPLLPK